jgi:ATP-dependent phosphofructokinase / diphosphate-dependent phosphofructokinase
MRFGIEGFMAENLIDLSAEPRSVLNGLKRTPSSALGSCRLKLKEEDLPRVLTVVKKYGIRYMFLIGGNDTMDTIHRVCSYAAKQGFELTGVGIPKTVDNDLYGTDHTPGFPSAARYMALSVLQAGVLARDMRRVDQFSVFQCIGRKAGWLPAATALAKRETSDAPHILLLPERPFEKRRFLKAVKSAYDRYGFVSIVCGEGIVDASGAPVSASRVKDKFNNPEFGAMGGTSAAMALHRLIAGEFGFRGEFQIPESLPMCAADRGVALDFREAWLCGQAAVKLAAKGMTDVMVTLKRVKGKTYRVTTGTAPLSEVAERAKPLPDHFIGPDGYSVTKAFLDYARPLVGPLPTYSRLSNKKIRG